MAALHCAVTSIQRSAGKTAPAAAAYAAGIRIVDERIGVVQDYRRRRGVDAVGLVGWHRSIADLWNRAEAAEKHPRGITGRTAVISLPHELDHEARRALTERIAGAARERWGVAVLWAVHAPDRQGDQRNHHAHVVWTSRAVTDDGRFGAKTRSLDVATTSGAEINWFRATVAELSNDQLTRAGSSARVDHRSLSARAAEGGLASHQVVREIHLGPAASAMERAGVRTRAGDRNRLAREACDLAAEIAADEAGLAALQAERRRIANELTELTKEDAHVGPATGLDRGPAHPASRSPNRPVGIVSRRPAVGQNLEDPRRDQGGAKTVHRNDGRGPDGIHQRVGAIDRIGAEIRRGDRRVAAALTAAALARRLQPLPPVPTWSAAPLVSVPLDRSRIHQAVRQIREGRILSAIGALARGFLVGREEFRARRVLLSSAALPTVPVPAFVVDDRPAASVPFDATALRVALHRRRREHVHSPQSRVASFARAIADADALPPDRRSAVFGNSMPAAAALWVDPATKEILHMPGNERLRILALRAAVIHQTPEKPGRAGGRPASPPRKSRDQR